jgi:hypothetical protein
MRGQMSRNLQTTNAAGKYKDKIGEYIGNNE